MNLAFIKRLLNKKSGISIVVLLLMLLSLAEIRFIYGSTPNHTAENLLVNKVAPLANFGPETYEIEINNEIDSLIIPIKRAGNLILMEVVIDSLAGNLILDTGSSSMVLNSIYFRNERRSGNYEAGGITGGIGTVSRIQINSLQIAELYFNNLTANVGDLSHIERARNVKILGFCGLSIFNDFEVVVDLNNSVVELHRTNYRGKRIYTGASSSKTDVELQVEIISNVIFIGGTINRRKLMFCVDTGAESNVVSSVLPGHILEKIDITGRSNLRGAGNQNVEVLYGLLNELKIGKKNIRPMPVVLTNLSAMSQYYGIPIDGMLGCHFLEQGVFYFNMKRETLGITFYNIDEEYE